MTDIFRRKRTSTSTTLHTQQCRSVPEVQGLYNGHAQFIMCKTWLLILLSRCDSVHR